MPFVNAKCTNCGAGLEVDSTKEAAICNYCGAAYIVEKAINNYQVENHNTIHAQVVNIYGEQKDTVPISQKINEYIYLLNPNYSRISGIAYENGYVRENSSKTDTLQSFPPNKGALLPWGSDNF